jgi:hypothetical protein
MNGPRARQDNRVRSGVVGEIKVGWCLGTSHRVTIKHRQDKSVCT